MALHHSIYGELFMRTLSICLLIAMFLLTPVAAQQTKSLPPAVPLLSPALCGAGTYVVSLGTQPLGRETYEIKCVSDGGFSTTGNSKLNIPGAPLDLDTTLETDKSGGPLKFSVKGSAGGQTLDQTVTINKDVATVFKNGASTDVPYQGGAIFLSNVIYIYQFVLARYDSEKGGPQKIPLFGVPAMTVERTARDEVQPVGIATTPPVPFDRYSLQIGPAVIAIWTDRNGRVAVVHVPAQNLMAVREDYEAFAQPLRAALLASVKGLVPDYSAPPNAPFTAEEVSLKAKNWTLAGTLLLPKNAKGKLPVVVTSTGSGQQTRDEPLPIPGLEGYRPFRQIAEALASRGIAVLRCDDRGVGDSTGLETLTTATTFDFADDVRAQVAYLRTRPDIDPDRIAILGHSEGGVIAPLVAAADKRIAAIVLLAGTGKRGDEVLRYQLNYPYDNNPTLSQEERDKKHQETEEFLHAIITGGDMSKYPLALRGLASPWGKAFLKYDPLATIRKVHQPILILQGAIDQQVTADQATMLLEAAKTAGNKSVAIQVFPSLNHLFLRAKTGAESEYTSLPTARIGDDVLAAIGDWLTFTLHAGNLVFSNQ
jgi:dienelactone hydrolase